MRAAATGEHAARVDPVNRQPADQPSDVASRGGLHFACGNLPAELTSFIGRSAELRSVRELLVETRLLTLVGVGGCGKTRLALQSARSARERFPGGAWWVELAALQDPELLAVTVIETLGLRERSGQRPEEVLREHLRDQRTLLVLDNCEHVVEVTADLVDALLRSCPELVIMATSREVLGVPGEVPYRVPPLDLVAPTGSPEDVMHSDALRLLVDRAVLARPDFAPSEDNAQALQAICRGLDGIPLAIELAAARMRVLSPRQIADELGDRLRLLSGSARSVAARHQTLRASIDWSHALCTEHERVLLRRLSVWRGGWTLDGAEAVSADEILERRAVLDVLTGLVDKSLIDAHELAGETRYGMLETIRQYAAERLADAGEADAINARHLGWCLQLAERAEPELVRHDARTWLDRLEVEDANLRLALERATASDVDVALRLAAALTFFWLMRGRLEEGTASMERVLYKTPESSALRGRVRWGISYLNIQLRHDKFDACYYYASHAVEDGEAASDRGLIARGFGAIYIVLMADEWPDHGRERLKDNLARARDAHDMWWTAEATRLVAWSHVRQAEHDLARPVLEDAYALARELGYKPMYAAYFQMRAWGELEHGQVVAARQLAEQAAAIAREIGEPLSLGLATALLVECDVLQGRPAVGRSRGESGAQLMRSSGTRNAQLSIECALAFADIAQGAPGAARQRMEAARALIPKPDGGAVAVRAVREQPVRVTDQRARAHAPFCVALLLLGELDDAHDEAQQLLAHARASSNEHVEATARDLLGRVALARGSIVAAKEQLQQSLAIAARRDFRVLMINGLESLARVAALTDEPEASARLLAAVTAAREQSELARWPPQPDVWSAVEHDIRAELGDDAFARAWEDGLALSLEDAAAYALRGHDQREREHDEESLKAPELLLGDLDEARDDALHGLAWALKQDNEKVEARLRHRLGCVALARGALVEAEDQLQQSLAISVRRDFREQLINSLESLARVAALTDSPAEAARLLAAAAGAREESQILRWSPQPGFWAALEDDLRMQLGDDAFARAWTDGLKLSLEDAAEYARRGRGQRKRPKHGWESLTPTELQVVRHVTDGLTNPQIAERMYISRATVKAHLSHIFAKLQASSRSELAARATKRGFDAPDTPQSTAR